MTKEYVAYYRVSTQEQGRSALGIEAQRVMAKNYAQQNGGTIVREFTEIESGKRSDRPKLVEALGACKSGKKILLIAKLDRLARNVRFISTLMEGDVKFEAADLPMANRFTVHILAAVAEQEAHAISLRTKDALGSIKARIRETGSHTTRAGKVITKLGSPMPISAEVSAKGRPIAAMVRRNRLAELDALRRKTVMDVIEDGAMTYSAIGLALDRAGDRPQRARNWNIPAVKRLLTRLDISLPAHPVLSSANKI